MYVRFGGHSKGGALKDLSSAIVKQASKSQEEYTGDILIDMMNGRRKTALMLASAVGNVEYVDALLWAKAGF